MNSQRGLALLMVVLITTFLSALGIGVMMAVFMDRLATGNQAGAVSLLYAADAGIAIAARDLARANDWNTVLSGAERSAFTDAAPAGVRDVPGGGTVDLSATTNLLNCGKTNNCTPAQMNATSHDRPWGVNNPRWKLYVYGPMAQLTELVRPAPCYLAVWIADDYREQDGDAEADAADDADAGHGIVRVHAEAFGAAGARRVLEAELSKICQGGEDGCLPGIRVQSWQELQQVIP